MSREKKQNKLDGRYDEYDHPENAHRPKHTKFKKKNIRRKKFNKQSDYRKRSRKK
tara:strand:+ start:3202 stop:3366 length:165 start_codon:yes stop_codon:yes gene_type:complete